MTSLEQKYSEYRRELKKLQDQKDAWYTIANQKFSEGDEDGQDKAYDEIEAVQAKIDALIDPLQGKILGENEGLL